MPNALERRATIDWHIVFIEQRNLLLIIFDALADVFNGGLLARGQAHTWSLEFLEYVQCAYYRTHAVITVNGALLEHKRVLIAAVFLVVDAIATRGHGGRIDDRLGGQADLP